MSDNLPVYGVDCVVLPMCLFYTVYVSIIVVHILIASSGSVKYA